MKTVSRSLTKSLAPKLTTVPRWWGKTNNTNIWHQMLTREASALQPYDMVTFACVTNLNAVSIKMLTVGRLEKNKKLMLILSLYEIISLLLQVLGHSHDHCKFNVNGLFRIIANSWTRPCCVCMHAKCVYVLHAKCVYVLCTYACQVA